MSDQLSCKEMEVLFFELRGDGVSDLQRALVEEHLEQCPSCRELMEKVEEILDLASEEEIEHWAALDNSEVFGEIEEALRTQGEGAEGRLDEAFQIAREREMEEWVDLNQDALFERIAGRLPASVGEEKSSKDEGVVVLEERRSERGEKERRRQKWGVWGAVAAAAAVVVGAAVFWDLGPEEQGGQELALGMEGAAEQEAVVDVSGEERLVEAADEEPAIRLASVAAEREELREGWGEVFTSDDARMELVESGDTLTVELTRGSILVEYFPGAYEHFEVRAGGRIVSVVGTIFFVSLEGEELQVTVLEGAVEVRSQEEEVATVEAGLQWNGKEKVAASERMREELGGYVDLEAHRERLQEIEERRAEALRAEELRAEVLRERLREEAMAARVEVLEEVAEAPEEERVEEVEEEPVMTLAAQIRGLRSEALEAQHQGEYRDASRLLRGALDLVEPGDRAGADILLELGRIEIRNLGRAEEGARYLRRFLAEWPQDRAAESVRTQLCSMELAEEEVFCP